MAILILGLLIFLGIHSVRIVAPQWRDARVAAMGEGPWKGIYSLISLVGFVLIVWGYALARPQTYDLYAAPAWLMPVVSILMAASLVSLMVGNLPAGRLKPMLKHPMLLSVKIWALAHLLVNADLAAFLLFGTFLAWAVVDRISVKRRNEPIASAGPPRNDVIAVLAGLALWAFFVWFGHEWLFGVPVLLF